jgi:hypothetical protein
MALSTYGIECTRCTTTHEVNAVKGSEAVRKFMALGWSLQFDDRAPNGRQKHVWLCRSCYVLWSMTNSAGIPIRILTQHCERCTATLMGTERRGTVCNACLLKSVQGRLPDLVIDYAKRSSHES